MILILSTKKSNINAIHSALDTLVKIAHKEKTGKHF